MIRTQIQLELPTYERLKKRAAELQCSISELARQGIEEKLARHAQERKWTASFEAMGRQSISRAFTFDRPFAEEGFVICSTTSQELPS